MSASYLEIIQDHWDSILELCQQFEDTKPVMVFDIQAETGYAFPYQDLTAELNQKSRLSLKEQYERAVANNYKDVFVRDIEQGQMFSYLVSLEDQDE